MLTTASGADRLTAHAVRAAQFLGKVVWELSLQVPVTESSFLTHYGPGGHVDYWEFELAEINDLGHFLDILAKLGAVNLEDLDKRRDYLRRAMFDASCMDQDFFRGNSKALAAITYDWQMENIDGVKVRGRRVAEWMLSHPKWLELVPPTLVSYLKPQSEPVAATLRVTPPSSVTIEQWFREERLPSLPERDRWYSEADDLDAAAALFGSVQRKTIRSLRKQYVAAERMKQGPRAKSANPPG